MKILLVEDEERLSEALVYVLKKNKYDVDAAYDGIEGERMALSGDYDIIILDRMLPGKDGVEALKTIRAANIAAPVIFITAKHTIADRIEGLDAGADDYLVKPFANDELLARIRALSRRAGTAVEESEEIIIGKSKFIPRRGEIYYGKNYENTINLTLKETGILEMLCKSGEKAVTKEELLTKLWGHENDGDVNIVEVFISYLRKKIDVPALGFSIVTLRGLGYKIKANPQKSK